MSSNNPITVAYLNYQGGTRSKLPLDLSKEILGLSRRESTFHVNSSHKRGEQPESGLSQSPAVHAGGVGAEPNGFSGSSSRLWQPRNICFCQWQKPESKRILHNFLEKKSEGLDSLTQVWQFKLAYAFPPLTLSLRVLQKISQSSGYPLLIVP